MVVLVLFPAVLLETELGTEQAQAPGSRMEAGQGLRCLSAPSPGTGTAAGAALRGVAAAP